MLQSSRSPTLRKNIRIEIRVGLPKKQAATALKMAETYNYLTSKNMIIVMQPHAPKENVQGIIMEIESHGLQPMPLYGTERTVIAVIGDERILDRGHLSSLPSVDKVMTVLEPYKLAARETKHEGTVIDVGKGVSVGGVKLAIMAGPCSVESESQMEDIAKAVKVSGASILRGGAFKPRTGPYSFEGLGEIGLRMMRSAADRHGLAMITEVLDVRHIDLVCRYTDIIQVGARNMQNFTLLRELGKIHRPVMLKRGLSATIEEFLLAAEYILSGGNTNVILCERGIRTFEKETRNTLALTTVPLVKELSHLPIIVDPSHGTGKASLVRSMARAGIAAGADGLQIEVHTHPEEALSDADQTITPEEFDQTMKEVAAIAVALGREI